MIRKRDPALWHHGYAVWFIWRVVEIQETTALYPVNDLSMTGTYCSPHCGDATAGRSLFGHASRGDFVITTGLKWVWREQKGFTAFTRWPDNIISVQDRPASIGPSLPLDYISWKDLNRHADCETSSGSLLLLLLRPPSLRTVRLRWVLLASHVQTT